MTLLQTWRAWETIHTSPEAFEDLTEAQTAEMLGCSLGTVKSQASKALIKLGVDRALSFDRIEVSP